MASAGVQRAPVFFLGPLPPPVHGFSNINLAMLRELQSRGEVRVFDRAARSPGALRSVAMAAGLWVRFVLALVRQRPSGLYAGISGGGGQWLDLPFLAVARLFGLPVIAHHHSFAYVNSTPSSARHLMQLLRGQLHVVLCECMGELLCRRYGLSSQRLHLLSNAAFVHSESALGARNVTRPLTIGFLSNISADKGIFDFFAVLRSLAHEGVPVFAEIAGPVDPDIAQRFRDELSRLPSAVHVGPVYGDAKLAFFCRLDVLLFPTRYVNEAEPVTLFEAMSAGVVPIAAQRSCIVDIVGADAGIVTPIERFEHDAVEAVKSWVADRELLAAMQVCARERFATLHRSNRDSLEQLLDVIMQPLRAEATDAAAR